MLRVEWYRAPACATSEPASPGHKKVVHARVTRCLAVRSVPLLTSSEPYSLAAHNSRWVGERLLRTMKCCGLRKCCRLGR